MKIRLSSSMIKCIEEVKEESWDLILNLKELEKIKIKKKPTKKKIFEFHIMNFNKSPFIQVFINDKFFETLFLENGKWVEEKKNFEN